MVKLFSEYDIKNVEFIVSEDERPLEGSCAYCSIYLNYPSPHTVQYLMDQYFILCDTLQQENDSTKSKSKKLRFAVDGFSVKK